MAASFSRSCLPQSPEPCTCWLKIAQNSGALESRTNNLACALLGKTGAGFELNCFIPRNVTRPDRDCISEPSPPGNYKGSKVTMGAASPFKNNRVLRFARVTFGFLLSPKMPSCSISLLARALSDTNTIGWHVGDGRGR